MGGLLDLLGQILGSNLPTILSCAALVVAGAFYYFKVVPAMEELAEYKEKEADGYFSADSLSLELDIIKKSIAEIVSENPDSSVARMLGDVLRSSQELERSLNSLGRDTQFNTGVMRDLLQTMGELRHEVSAMRQRIQTISGAIYSNTGARDDESLGDLRGLR